MAPPRTPPTTSLSSSLKIDMQINVYPNPFVTLAPDGMPGGRCIVEPTHPRPLDIVGGKLRRVVLPNAEDESRSAKEIAAARRLDVRDVRVRAVADVRMRPCSVPLVQYWKERVACGDVIAADPASAMACGIANFDPPFELLRAALQKGIAAWQAINGELPAVASYDLVKNGDEIALAAKDAPVPIREARPNVPPTR